MPGLREQEKDGHPVPSSGVERRTCGEPPRVRASAATARVHTPVLARIIAGTVQALALLWSSPAAAATFAAGAVDFGTMFRTGVVTIVLTSIVVIVLRTILVPAFGAYTLR